MESVGRCRRNRNAKKEGKTPVLLWRGKRGEPKNESTNETATDTIQKTKNCVHASQPLSERARLPLCAPKITLSRARVELKKKTRANPASSETVEGCAASYLVSVSARTKSIHYSRRRRFNCACRKKVGIQKTHGSGSGGGGVEWSEVE